MRMSSIYPWTSSLYCALIGQSSLFIILWKVAGAFLRPKFITMGSYCPNGVLNAPLCWSPSFIRMLWYPHLMLNLVNRVFPWSVTNLTHDAYLFPSHLFSLLIDCHVQRLSTVSVIPTNDEPGLPKRT